MILKAVSGIDFEITRGQTFALVGESGCGKSTCCLAIAKLRDPTGGAIMYKERNISEMSKSEIRNYRSEVQLIFQDPYESLNPRYTVLDLVA